MPVSLLCVERVHTDIRAEIKAVHPASDFIATVLLAHVHENGVVHKGRKQGGAVAAGGRLKECFDGLGKSGERHGITSFAAGSSSRRCTPSAGGRTDLQANSLRGSAPGAAT